MKLLRAILPANTGRGRTARKLRDWAILNYYGSKGRKRVVNGITMHVVPIYAARFPREYDVPVANFIRDRIKPGMTVFNVGANLGIYTLQFAHWVGPTGKVVAFEPNPSTAKVLTTNIEMSGYTDRVQVVQKAVSSSPGVAKFYAMDTDGMSRLGSANPLIPQATAIDVEVITLDDYCRSNNIVPDWIMMDVEGFEPAVIAGFRQTLTANRSMQIVVEMHPGIWEEAGSSNKAFRDLFQSLGLRAVPLTGQKDPIDDYGIIHLQQI